MTGTLLLISGHTVRVKKVNRSNGTCNGTSVEGKVKHVDDFDPRPVEFR